MGAKNVSFKKMFPLEKGENSFGELKNTFWGRFVD